MLLANFITGRTNFFHLCSRWFSESQNWRTSPSSNGILITPSPQLTKVQSSFLKTLSSVSTSQINVNFDLSVNGSVSVVLTKTFLVFLGILYARVWCFPSSFSWQGFSIKSKSSLPVKPWNRKKKHIGNWLRKFQFGHFYENWQKLDKYLKYPNGH